MKSIESTGNNKNINQKKMKPEITKFALRPDAQAFDEIRLKTIPRFKESELSGDEWRISTVVEFYRNGELVHTSGGTSNMETMCGFLYSEFHRAISDGKAYFAGDGVHCDQEGCTSKAAFMYRIKEAYDDRGKRDAIYDGYHRCFCEKHSSRGNSDLGDRDENYELVTVLSA